MEEARAAIGGELERFADNTLEYIRQRGAAHVRAARAAAAAHEVRGPPRAGRRARPRLPHDLAALRSVHPRVPAGAHRRRRRRRRAARGRPEARHHHRRLRLGVGAGPCTAAPSSCTTCTPTVARPGRENLARRGASTTTSSWPRARARTSRCCSRTSRARSSSSRSGRTRRWSSSSTRAGAGMASTFLTRLRLGPGARRREGREPALRGPRPPPRHRCCSSVRPLLAMVVVGIVAEPIHVFMRGLWVTLKDVFSS